MTLSKDPVLSSRKSVQRLPFQQDIRQTLPQRCSYSATKQIWTWPASYSLSQSTCHWPLQTKCQEHSISGNRRWGFIQNRTSLTEVEVAVLPSRAGEKSSHHGLFWSKGLFTTIHAKPYPPLLCLRTSPGMTETIDERSLLEHRDNVKFVKSHPGN